jgi:deoxyribodipyrimidine photo-lyase
MKNIHPDRVHLLGESSCRDQVQYVLYWMSLSFRAHWNYALEYAVGLAEATDSKVVVLISLEPQQTHLNARHLTFLLESLPEIEQALVDRGIKCITRVAPIEKNIEALTADAFAMVTDCPYLDEDRDWLERALNVAQCPITQIEGNLIVPVEAASSHQEYAARTLRPKITECYIDYLEKPTSSMLPKSSLNMSLKGEDISEPGNLLHQIEFEQPVAPVAEYHTGGFSAAKSRLDHFLHNDLEAYEDQRQSPTQPAVTQLSMYLSMGMIAPAYVLKRIEAYLPSENAAALREELLVRRELACNFVYYADHYDRLSALPDWAQQTLDEHERDQRPHRYTRSELEAGATHDDAWNACMNRMKEYGYLHNHMRMYWGNQILIWCNTPDYAHQTLLYLNNKYFLDGNDPNSYANALWVFGLHDRAWKERKVFGKVRPMNHNGLRRKIDLETWLQMDPAQ